MIEKKRQTSISGPKSSKKIKSTESPKEIVDLKPEPECSFASLYVKYSPLLRIDASKWTLEDAQPLLDEFVSANTWCSHKKCKKLIRAIELYEETHESGNEAKPTASKQLDAKVLYKIVKNLPQKRKDWAPSQIEKLKKLYEGVNSVNMKGLSAKEAEIVSPFLYQWEKYLEENPKVADDIDPYYVLFDFTNLGAVPGGWGASIAAAPAILGAAAINTAGGNPCDWFFTVAGGNTKVGLANANHFGGFMSGRHPGLEFFVVKLTSTQAFYSVKPKCYE